MHIHACIRNRAHAYIYICNRAHAYDCLAHAHIRSTPWLFAVFLTSISPCFQLVSNFQAEAAAQKQEAENSKTKLASVRKLIAKLLKSTNEVSGCKEHTGFAGVEVCVMSD